MPATSAAFPGSTGSLAGLTAGSKYYWRARFVANGQTYVSDTQTFNTPGNGGSMGDPHLTTVDSTNYDFQGAGEYVLLRGAGLEIQSRLTAAASDAPLGPAAHTGLVSCVSVTTAVAMRFGKQRLTYQPRANAPREGLQLRVDGIEVNPSDAPLESAKLMATEAPGGLRIDAADGTIILITPSWWDEEARWTFNLDIRRTPAGEGLIGSLADGWLPLLPDGSSLGAMPADTHQRHVDLYEKFGDKWRVTDASSLFDYDAGTTTSTFTIAEWPPEAPTTCRVPGQEPRQRPIVTGEEARQLCAEVRDEQRRSHCEQDVVATGERAFAEQYLLTQKVGDTVGD